MAVDPKGNLINEVETTDKKLRKELSFVGLLFLSVGGIIGSGWLFAVLDADSIAGPAVIIAWLVGGILVLFIALNYAEVSGMIPRSGAIVRYPHYSHGSYTGSILGWAYLLSAVTVPTIEAEAVVQYAANYIPNLYTAQTTILGTANVLTGFGIAFAAALMVGFFFINFVGIKFLGQFNKYITIWKVVIPTLTFLILFTVFRASNFTAYGGFAPTAGGYSDVFIAIPTAGIVFSFLGFRQALEYGGEAKNPQRDIPRATILSVIIGIVVYVFLQIAFTGAINFNLAEPGVTGSAVWAGLTSSKWASGPFLSALDAAGISALVAWGYFVIVDAWVSPSGTGWVYLGTSTRVLYGMSTDGYYPKHFLRLNNAKIPWVALLGSLVIGMLFLLPFPSWYELVGFISSATVFTYIMGGIGLQVFRKTAKSLHRPFRLPFASILSPIGFVAAALIVYWSGYTLETFLVYAIFIGLPIYLIFYAPKNLGVPKKMFTALGIAFEVILIALLLANYYYVLVPAITNLSSGIAAPSSVFLMFPLLWLLLAILVVGTTLVLHRYASADKKQDISAGFWLIGFILVLMPMSFYGAFGPYLSTSSATIPFPWDNVVAIVVALIFYFLAVRAGYETEDMTEIIRLGGVVGTATETKE